MYAKTNKGKESKGNESKEKENEKKNERESHARVRENLKKIWSEWDKELLADEEWRYSAVRQSGKGVSFNDKIPNYLLDFQDFLISSGDEDTVPTKDDYIRRFHFWWQYHGCKENQEKQEKKGREYPSMEQIKKLGEETSKITLEYMKRRKACRANTAD